MLFGNRFKELRKKSGLLQKHIAAELDIDTPMYSKLERGIRLPKKEQLSILAKLLKVTDKELLTLYLADKLLKLTNEDPDININAIYLAHNQLRLNYNLPPIDHI